MQLSDSEKKVSALPALLLRPSTYAGSTCHALAYSTPKKPVPSRVLKEVFVKVIDDPKPSQTSGRQVKPINAACSSKAGKMLAVRKLDSGNIMITADNYKTKNIIEYEET
jgi:hypothetical protein